MNPDPDVRLPALLRTVLWAQDALDEHLRYPRITNRSDMTFEEPPHLEQPPISDAELSVRGLELASMSM